MTIIMPYQLTKNFNTNEFKVSDKYPKIAQKTTFTPIELLRLKYLCICILQPIRDHFGPIRILSGKRTPKLNKLVGGKNHSDHIYSSAADITPLNQVEPLEIWEWVGNKDLPFRQCILYLQQRFIHISINIPEKPDYHSRFKFS